MGKNVPPKRDPGFMKVGSLLGRRIYFYTDFDFSVEFFYKVRSRLTEARTLPECFFSIYKHPLNISRYSQENAYVGVSF